MARDNQPRFRNLPSGYLTWANATSNEETFLDPGFFDPAILQFSESTKQPFTTGEVLTLGGSPPTVPHFKGPVQVLVGGESWTKICVSLLTLPTNRLYTDQDFIFCGGDCSGPKGGPGIAGASTIPGAVAKAFPASRAFEAYIQPNTGHGINLHYNSTAAYKVTQEFLIAHGLGPEKRSWGKRSLAGRY